MHNIDNHLTGCSRDLYCENNIKLFKPAIEQTIKRRQTDPVNSVEKSQFLQCIFLV